MKNLVLTLLLEDRLSIVVGEKQMKDNKVSVIGTTGIPRSESTEALSIECINILLF